MTHQMPDPPPEDRLGALEARLREQSFELEVLQEVASRIGSSLDYATLLRAILGHLDTALPYDVAASLMLSEDSQWHFYRRCLRPLSGEMTGEVEERLITACQRLSRAPIQREQIQRISVEEGYALGTGEIRTLGSFFMVPILADRRTLGCIFVGAESPRQFSEQHIRLLYTVAGHASGAVERTQAFLEGERLRLRAILEHLPEGVVLLDDAGRRMLSNPAADDLLDQLAGLFSQSGKAGPEAALLDKLRDHSPQDFVIDSLARRVVQSAVVPLRVDSAEHWLMMLTDVTDSREAVRRRDRFLAMLSHELRNPLAALSNAAQVLSLEQDAAVMENVHGIIQRQTRHLTRLVDDLLDLSRFLHGKIRLERQTLDLADLVRRVIQAHQAEFQAQSRCLLFSGCGEPLWVQADAARLTQVLDNLLNNSRKFTTAGGTVEVTCSRQDSAAVLTVRDDGIGIPHLRQQEIFEPFVQIEDDRASRPNGLGLGLALVKALVELHGGGVSVASDGPGSGTQFSIRLPLVESASSRDGQPSPAAGPATCHEVLLIEDDPDVREMFRTLLKVLGHRVTVAANGREGLEAFARSRQRVVFLDIGLPEMNGYEVARALRASDGGAEALLVAMTGFARPEDKQRALEAGFDLHLAKPAELTVIRNVLAQASARTA